MAFLLSVVGAYLLARRALSPVSAVVAAAHRIREGDLSKRLPVPHSKDEIGDLAATINDMLAHLEVTLARLEETLDRQRRSDRRDHDCAVAPRLCDGTASGTALSDQRCARRKREGSH